MPKLNTEEKFTFNYYFFKGLLFNTAFIFTSFFINDKFDIKLSPISLLIVVLSTSSVLTYCILGVDSLIRRKRVRICHAKRVDPNSVLPYMIQILAATHNSLIFIMSGILLNLLCLYYLLLDKINNTHLLLIILCLGGIVAFIMFSAIMIYYISGYSGDLWKFINFTHPALVTLSVYLLTVVFAVYTDKNLYQYLNDPDFKYSKWIAIIFPILIYIIYYFEFKRHSEKATV